MADDKNVRVSSNQSENKKFNDAAKAARLTQEQKQKFHRELQDDPEKNNKTYAELLELAQTYNQEKKP